MATVDTFVRGCLYVCDRYEKQVFDSLSDIC
jgi:hypothetical protein